MLLSGKNWTLLDEAEIAQLQRIAKATKGRSSSMAKGALCFFFDICYEYEFEAEGGRRVEGRRKGSRRETAIRTYHLSQSDTVGDEFPSTIPPLR